MMTLSQKKSKTKQFDAQDHDENIIIISDSEPEITETTQSFDL